MSATDDDIIDVQPFLQHDNELPVQSPVTPLSPDNQTQPSSITEVQAENVARTVAPTSRTVPTEMLGTQPEISEKTNIKQSHFWEDYTGRVSAGQDLLILISDYHNDRGTGKTTLTIDLCEKMDLTDDGFTPEKASISPERLINGYTDHPKRSALALDEAEAGVGAREAMTRINRMLSEIVSMGRVEEKYVVLNMPASNHIDKNILDLAHYWILVQRRGLARVYDLRNNPFEQKKYPTPVQRLRWSDIDKSHPVYQALTKEKRQRLRNPNEDGGERFVPYDDHAEAVEKAREEARKQARDEIISRMLQHPEVNLPQRVIGNVCLGMSQSHVGNVKGQLSQDGGTEPITSD
jgi:hypothetical protein